MKNCTRQRLLALLKFELKELEIAKIGIKEKCQYHWKRANPKSAKGKMAFVLLNDYRDYQRKINTRIKKIVTLIKELKKEVKKPAREFNMSGSPCCQAKPIPAERLL